jgi:beta-N-acetylhexosaminidase
MGLREDVGSLFIVGLEGTVLSATEAAWLKLLRPSGVILFRRNIEDPSQIHALLQAASAFSTTPLFRCIDVEGGLVDRLRDLIAPMPSAAAVAFTAERKLAQRHGRLIGDELTLLGLNTTFAPVLDLALPASASVMKSRVAGPTAEQVIAYAESLLTGLRKAGVLGCGKHFPGLGGGTLDSHLAMPEIDRVWEQLWDEDQRPYRKLHRKLPFIMISHAAYPRVKESDGPASLSKYWIRDVLKKKIGYRGLVLSDDMEMGGVLSGNSIEEASVAAIEAGTRSFCERSKQSSPKQSDLLPSGVKWREQQRMCANRRRVCSRETSPQQRQHQNKSRRCAVELRPLQPTCWQHRPRYSREKSVRPHEAVFAESTHGRRHHERHIGGWHRRRHRPHHQPFHERHQASASRLLQISQGPARCCPCGHGCEGNINRRTGTPQLAAGHRVCRCSAVND